MNFFEKDQDVLTDQERIAITGDVPEEILSILQRMRAQAMSWDFPLRRKIVENYLETYPSREGRQADRIVDSIKAKERALAEEQADKMVESTRESEASQDESSDSEDFAWR